VLLLLAVGLRAIGGWGNIRVPRDASWIEFLNNVKYPPSFVFWTMSVGILLIILAGLVRAPEWLKSERSPLIVFGQTPLFFYIAHFLLLGVLEFAFFRTPSSLEGCYAVWVLVLVLLYPVCAWYRRFKMGKARESLWRVF
jgi:uncharacterized membrane protein